MTDDLPEKIPTSVDTTDSSGGQIFFTEERKYDDEEEKNYAEDTPKLVEIKLVSQQLKRFIHPTSYGLTKPLTILKEAAQSTWWPDTPLCYIILSDGKKAFTQLSISSLNFNPTQKYKVVKVYNLGSISNEIDGNRRLEHHRELELFSLPVHHPEIKTERIVCLDTCMFSSDGARLSDIDSNDRKECCIYTYTVKSELEIEKIISLGKLRITDPDIHCFYTDEFKTDRRRDLFASIYPLLYEGKPVKDIGLLFPRQKDSWDGTDNQHWMASAFNDASIWFEALAISRRQKKPVLLYTRDSDFKRFAKIKPDVLEKMTLYFPAETIKNVTIKYVQANY